MLTTVVIFADADGSAPLIDWLDRQSPKVQDKLTVRIDLLEAHGHELRRPHADLLRDGIHELRAAYQGVNYRVLYFFHRRVAVLSHGITKEGVVPPVEIDRAVRRMEAFARDPTRYTYRDTAGEEEGPPGGPS